MAQDRATPSTRVPRRVRLAVSDAAYPHGAAPENRDVRSALWGISGKRGYPQVFMEGQFIGDMEEGDNNIQVWEPAAHEEPGARMLARFPDGA